MQATDITAKKHHLTRYRSLPYIRHIKSQRMAHIGGIGVFSGKYIDIDIFYFNLFIQ